MSWLRKLIGLYLSDKKTQNEYSEKQTYLNRFNQPLYAMQEKNPPHELHIYRKAIFSQRMDSNEI